ncbi:MULTISPECIES: hypothetical protein [Alphaproteobacteria]|uniref:argonaute/piwi family protein n=1 Tax=Alphaproteobacteria TaxID=28211 RepID=UPI000066BE44|nr:MULTISPECIES: hypothetical protein [unclassified Sulfitobacter]AXI50465.1 hypothetical protein C1J04_05885 [Sulfitobacter sp. SK025]EAP80207.1 hypothetical protein NAS141_16063 [Sulfitobacter sp. NAS-14.1]
MTFKATVFDEPELQFGDGQKHVDPREGLRRLGPLQLHAGEVVTVGVIGSSETAEGFTQFLTESQQGVEAASNTLPNLNPDFPGLGNANPFGCRFVVPNTGQRALSKRQIKKIVQASSTQEAINLLLDAVEAEARVLQESSAKPDVVVFSMPIDLIEKVVMARSENGEPDDDGGPDVLNFRDMMKAKMMELGVATQIVWPDVFDPDAKIPQKIKRQKDRKIQSPATRTWNLLNGLFYKAGKVPWRLYEPRDYTTNFLGIGFHRSLDGQQLWTSTAQMFDETGHGLILRGARAQTETRGRRPYLTRADMKALVLDALRSYKEHHKALPARLVVLKTSHFRDEEADGVDDALEELDVSMCDMVWVQESSPISLLRNGSYPVLRGTFVELDGKGLLYTRGSVPYYSTYPGMRVPNPLLLCPHKQTDRSITQIAEEILALTKVNWNSTQFDQKLPAPIRASREVGRVLKHVAQSGMVRADFRFYT